MDEKYWFCLTHHAVEQATICPSIDRLGPYDTYADASLALEKVAQRNEQWDNDPNWNDED
jgi:hypothetical protein